LRRTARTSRTYSQANQVPARVSLPGVRITHGMPSDCQARLRALLGAALGADEGGDYL